MDVSGRFGRNTYTVGPGGGQNGDMVEVKDLELLRQEKDYLVQHIKLEEGISSNFKEENQWLEKLQKTYRADIKKLEIELS